MVWESGADSGDGLGLVWPVDATVCRIGWIDGNGAPHERVVTDPGSAQDLLTAIACAAGARVVSCDVT